MADIGRMPATKAQACLKAAAACLLYQALQDASSKHSVPRLLTAHSTRRRHLNCMRHSPAPFSSEAVTRTSAASAGGYPYTPVLMAGNARFSSLRLLARSRQLLQVRNRTNTAQ